MKYENFKQITSLVQQVEKHQRNLDELENPNNQLNIVNVGGGKIYTIGLDMNCEHEYAYQARELIDYIKKDLTTRINNLKSQLELL